MKFQDKFYDIIGHKKCPSSEKSAEICIWRKSNFHGILPTYVRQEHVRELGEIHTEVHPVSCSPPPAAAAAEGDERWCHGSGYLMSPSILQRYITLPLRKILQSTTFII